MSFDTAPNSNKPTSAALLDAGQMIIDGLSIVSDFIVPGAGGAWDILNAFIYFLRSWFTSDKRAASGLRMCGWIQLACILLLGPGQLFGSALKKFARTGKVSKPGLLKRGLIWVTSVKTSIANWGRGVAIRLLSHPAIQKIFKVFGKKGENQLEVMKNSFEAARVAASKELDELLTRLPASNWKYYFRSGLVSGSKALGEELGEDVVTNTLKRLIFPKATLRASGFVEGKTYQYASKEFSQATIQKITDSHVTCSLIRPDGSAVASTVPIFEFLDTAVGQFLRNKRLWRLPKGRLIGTVVGRHYARGMYYYKGVWGLDEEKVNQKPVDPNVIALTDAEINQKQKEVPNLFVIINEAYNKNLHADDYNDPKLIAFLNELERKYQIPTSNDVNDGNIAILIRDLLKKGYSNHAKSATFSLSDNRRINLIQNILRKNSADAIKEMDGILQKIRTKRGG